MKRRGAAASSDWSYLERAFLLSFALPLSLSFFLSLPRSGHFLFEFSSFFKSIESELVSLFSP